MCNNSSVSLYIRQFQPWKDLTDIFFTYIIHHKLPREEF